MLLLIKSLYTLSLLYFELPLLLSNPINFCFYLAAFNHIFALFLRLRSCRKDYNVKTGWILNFMIASFLVFVAGGSLFNLNTWAFASLLSSVSFLEILQDQQLVSK